MTPSKATYPPGHKIQKTTLSTPSKTLPDDASAKTASPTPQEASLNPQAPQDTSPEHNQQQQQQQQQPPITTTTTTTLPTAATSRSRAQRNNRKRHHYLNYLTCRPQPDQIQHSLQILFPQPPSYISFPADSRILSQPNATTTTTSPHDEIMQLKEQISGMQMLMNQMMLQQQQMAVEMARLVMTQKEGLFSNCRGGGADHHLRHNSEKSNVCTKPEGFQAKRNEVDDFFLVSDESDDGFDF
ncbi:hypothetical protein HDU78_005292 [Chytriomyces hyalinus]|nr:hypothetical protein HDU78_005292 [Chytriomyces hyalinus]